MPACDNCYKRKVQCFYPETGGDKCEWCHHRDIPCTYDRIKERKAKGKRLKESKNARNQRDDYAERIKRLEEFTAQFKSLKAKKEFESAPQSPDPVTIPSLEQVLADTTKPAPGHVLPPLVISTTPPPSKPQEDSRARLKTGMGQIYFAGLELGSVDSHTGMPILSGLASELIFKATGTSPNFDAANPTQTTGHRPIPAYRLLGSPKEKTDLPEESLVRYMLQAMFESKMNMRLPIIDAVLFEDIIEMAYRPGDGEPTYEKMTSRACVFAFACFVGVRTGENQRIDIDACAREAQGSVMDILEDPSLTMLQTILMLNLYHVVSGRFLTAYMLHATACRTLFILGAHKLNVPPAPPDRPLSHAEREDRHLRWIFWICYILDKDLALRTGQPSIIGDEFCDLTLPAGYTQNGFASDVHIPSPKLTAPDKTPLLPCDIRLSMIKSRACRLLYSAEAMRKSDAELLQTIRQLDEEVENWRLSLSPDIAPTLSVSSASLLSLLKSGTQDTMHRIDLHLEYHHLMSVIHHASGRCMALEAGLPPDRATLSILESSLELSVEASRSTILYLSVAANEMASEAAWVILFYPIAALMTLFFNLLRDPLHHNALNDLDLINLARAIIKNVPASEQRPQAATSLERLDLLIAELGRLGGLATQRARNGIESNGDEMSDVGYNASPGL